jgi:hypothetical protein
MTSPAYAGWFVRAALFQQWRQLVGAGFLTEDGLLAVRTRLDEASHEFEPGPDLELLRLIVDEAIARLPRHPGRGNAGSGAVAGHDRRSGMKSIVCATIGAGAPPSGWPAGIRVGKAEAASGAGQAIPFQSRHAREELADAAHHR